MNCKNHRRLTIAAATLAAAAWLPAHAHAQRSANPWTDPPGGQEEVHAPLALNGYCVVSLRDLHQWQPGEAGLAVNFDGLEYRFATPRERDIFAAAPQAYVPLLGGDCPLTFAETGKRQPGLPECGALHGDRLCFFANDALREKFLANPRAYEDVDLALDGHCAVSRRDRRVNTPGIPEATVIHHGLRYLFASALDRSLFLRNPGRYDGTNSGDNQAAPLSPPHPRPRVAPPESKVAVAKRGGKTKDPHAPGGLPGRDSDVVLGAQPAMAGYCPVTLKQQGLWVRGRYDYRVDLDGLVLLTAGQKEKEALIADPLAYIPVLGGDCPVTFRSRNERVRGSVFHAVEFEGRLYLFADADRKATFKATPAPYVNIDFAENGLCTVTRLDEHRDVPGLADCAAWHHGRVYRFAGPEQKQKFLADPSRYAVDGDK